MVYARVTRVQSFFYVLFCLMIILAGGVFLADAAQTTEDRPLALIEAVDPLRGHPDDIEGAILAALGPLDETPQGHVLVSYLLWAFQTGKSDAYIDALLNSAAARGHFGIPAPFVTESGRLDTGKILDGVMRSTQSLGTDVAELAPEHGKEKPRNSGL